MTITKFENSCHLIFNRCSQRIKMLYENSRNKGLSKSLVDFYPDDRTLIEDIINNKLTSNNRYLIPKRALNSLVHDSNYFHDENELLWGDNIYDYLEDFFIAMILDIQEIPEYSKHLLNLSLTNTEDIKEYFQQNFSLASPYYEELKDKFIDFTYNRFDTIYISEKDSVFSFEEKTSVTLSSKDKDSFLSFKNLPEKLDLLAKYVLLPIIDKITLENLINKND